MSILVYMLLHDSIPGLYKILVGSSLHEYHSWYIWESNIADGTQNSKRRVRCDVIPGLIKSWPINTIRNCEWSLITFTRKDVKIATIAIPILMDSSLHDYVLAWFLGACCVCRNVMLMAFSMSIRCVLCMSMLLVNVINRTMGLRCLLCM